MCELIFNIINKYKNIYLKKEESKFSKRREKKGESNSQIRETEVN